MRGLRIGKTRRSNKYTGSAIKKKEEIQFVEELEEEAHEVENWLSNIAEATTIEESKNFQYQSSPNNNVVEYDERVSVLAIRAYLRKITVATVKFITR